MPIPPSDHPSRAVPDASGVVCPVAGADRYGLTELVSRLYREGWWRPTALPSTSSVAMVVLFGLLSLCGVRPLFAQQNSVALQSMEARVLRPGDAVRITVWRNSELSGEFAVAADSTLRHPLYQDVQVAGLPLPLVRERLRGFLTRYEAKPEFVIEPLYRVAVGGEVRQPNLYALPPETTVVQAVAMAGGATREGSLKRVLLMRQGEEQLLDLTDPGAAFTQTFIRSGDQILVLRRRNFFRDYLVPGSTVVVVALQMVALVRSLAN